MNFKIDRGTVLDRRAAVNLMVAVVIGVRAAWQPLKRQTPDVGMFAVSGCVFEN